MYIQCVLYVKGFILDNKEHDWSGYVMLFITFALVVEEDGISVTFADATTCYCYLLNLVSCKNCGGCAVLPYRTSIAVNN